MTKTITIFRNGAGWGNRTNAEAAILEAERIIGNQQLYSDVRLRDFIETSVEFDDQGRSAWTRKPIVVEVTEGANVLSGGKVLARWLGGVRQDLAEIAAKRERQATIANALQYINEPARRESLIAESHQLGREIWGR